MKYHFMYENRSSYHIARMAKALKVSESGYYKWLKRINGEPSEKELEDEILSKKIWEYYRTSRGSFGIRQMTRKLNLHRLHPVNHKRVERLMRQQGLFSKVKKKHIVTTDSAHDMPVADNLLNRNFKASAPDEKLVSDTTVIKTKEGYLYVAGIMDLYGRIPVGIAMREKNDTDLVITALCDMLIRGHGREGCMIHSDRGSTYCSKEYRKKLEENGLVCSMSRKGNCWDNAPMESFWGKMKNEWLLPEYDTLEAARRDVYEYVWSFYPRERPHSSDDNMTPYEYCQG